VEDNHIFADEPQQRHVCDFADSEFTEEEVLRIQRLFAAAPDLLAALEAIANFDRDVTGGPEMAAIARAALTKAKGGEG
jgi:hypothetical protein